MLSFIEKTWHAVLFGGNAAGDDHDGGDGGGGGGSVDLWLHSVHLWDNGKAI